jgi:HSP20 family protein
MTTYYVNPYRRMAAMRHAMERMFDENAPEATNEREMLLAVDVQADDEAYDITALVPGLEADDLDIEVLKNTVTIRGEFKTCGEEEVKYLVCELPNGRFVRTITLPTDVEATKVEASIKNGVLALRVPKAEAHRPKAIKVKTA